MDDGHLKHTVMLEYDIVLFCFPSNPQRENKEGKKGTLKGIRYTNTVV